jgi:hypothetical protein
MLLLKRINNLTEITTYTSFENKISILAIPNNVTIEIMKQPNKKTIKFE